MILRHAKKVNLTRPVMVVAAAMVLTAASEARDDLATLGTSSWVMLALFFVAIALGEMGRLTILTNRVTAPMSTAAALGLALTTIAPERSPDVGAAPVVVTVSTAMLIGNLILKLNGSPVPWGQVAARMVGVAVAAVLFRTVIFDGRTLLGWQLMWEETRWWVAMTMLLVGIVALLVDLVLQAVVRAGADHAPMLASIVDEVRSGAGLASALVASGALIALAEFAIGLAALPLFLLPLVLTYFSVQRYAAIRVTYRQTIGNLLPA